MKKFTLFFMVLVIIEIYLIYTHLIEKTFQSISFDYNIKYKLRIYNRNILR